MTEHGVAQVPIINNLMGNEDLKMHEGNKKKLTSFIWNNFLYCFSKAFLGSVRTCKKTLKSRHGQSMPISHQ